MTDKKIKLYVIEKSVMKVKSFELELFVREVSGLDVLVFDSFNWSQGGEFIYYINKARFYLLKRYGIRTIEDLVEPRTNLIQKVDLLLVFLSLKKHIKEGIYLVEVDNLSESENNPVPRATRVG